MPWYLLFFLLGCLRGKQDIPFPFLPLTLKLKCQDVLARNCCMGYSPLCRKCFFRDACQPGLRCSSDLDPDPNSLQGRSLSSEKLSRLQFWRHVFLRNLVYFVVDEQEAFYFFLPPRRKLNKCWCSLTFYWNDEIPGEINLKEDLLWVMESAYGHRLLV